MKKGLSIILLILFLFNVGGYYIVYWGLQYHKDQRLTERLDANLYDSENTVMLKIPLSLPYPIGSQGFQRVDGRFEHNGEYFKLVKSKVQNDTLYVVCIRDHETRQLVKTIKDYVLLTQGLMDSSPSQQAIHFLGKLVKDYCPQDDIELLHQEGFAMFLTYNARSEQFAEPLLPIHSPPPRA